MFTTRLKTDMGSIRHPFFGLIRRQVTQHLSDVLSTKRRFHHRQTEVRFQLGTIESLSFGPAAWGKTKEIYEHVKSKFKWRFDFCIKIIISKDSKGYITLLHTAYRMTHSFLGISDITSKLRVHNLNIKTENSTDSHNSLHFILTPQKLAAKKMYFWRGHVSMHKFLKYLKFYLNLLVTWESILSNLDQRPPNFSTKIFLTFISSGTEFLSAFKFTCKYSHSAVSCASTTNRVTH